jgi:hypothetical protein
MHEQTTQGGAATHAPMADVIRSSAWNWLLDVRRRLSLTIELVDARLNAVLPIAEADSVSAADRPVVDFAALPIRAVLARCLQSGEQQLVTVDRVNLACNPLRGADGSTVGVLVVADHHTEASNDPRSLARIAGWLANAVTEQAPPPPSGTAELHQLSSLFRILKGAASNGSEHDVVRAFLEALAVWQDAESWAYVADLSGHHTLEVTLPGSIGTDVPAQFVSRTIAGDQAVVRLPLVDHHQLGLPSDRAAYAIRVQGRAASDWLVLVSAESDRHTETRLALYGDVLARALDEVAAVESSRLTWAMLQHLLPMGAGAPLEQAARLAVDEVARAIGGSAWLVVVGASGYRPLTVGEPVRGAAASGENLSELLSLPVDAPTGYSASLGIRRPAERPLNARDEKLMRTAAFTLGAWLKALEHRLAAASQRRSGKKTFDLIIEQYAREAAHRGDEIAMVLVAVGPDASLRELTQDVIAQLRGRLRPTDLVGRLTSGDIAVLMLDTPADGAHLVLERIRSLFASTAPLAPFAGLPMGVAARRGAAGGSLIADAQSGAVRRSPPDDRDPTPNGA